VNLRVVKKHPVFNFEGETKGRFCESHKQKDMINVRSTICEFEDCNTQANYNYENNTIVRFCSKHKLDGMVNVHKKRCKTPLCTTAANSK